MRRVAVVVMAMAAVIGIAAAPAVAAPSRPGDVYRDGNGWCHYRTWDGTFYCGTQLYWGKPDGWPEVFVIGRGGTVYTRWSTTTSTSGWVSLGGTCDPNYSLAGSTSGWQVVVNCVAVNPANTWYHRQRYTDGSWDSSWLSGYKTL